MDPITPSDLVGTVLQILFFLRKIYLTLEENIRRRHFIVQQISVSPTSIFFPRKEPVKKKTNYNVTQFFLKKKITQCR
jgi:hypothetical protein